MCACKVIGFVHTKGGVGKTTHCCNLGIRFTQDNYRVMGIDADPQGNFYKWTRYREQFFEANTQMAPSTFTVKPSTSLMELIETVHVAQVENDILIIDTPGTKADDRFDIFIEMFKLCDIVIVPFRLSRFDTDALIENIKTINRNVPQAEQPEIRFLMSMVKHGTKQLATYKSQFSDQSQLKAFDCVIADRVGFPGATDLGLSIFETNDEPKAIEETEALYQQVLKTLFPDVHHGKQDQFRSEEMA